MTEEEKREMDEWVKRGSKTEITITQAKPKAIGIDWEAVFKNPLTWICIGVVVFGGLALRELGGIQQSVNAIDRINKRMRQSLEEEHDRLIEEEARSGKPFTFENPENARWWEEEKRKRGK